MQLQSNHITRQIGNSIELNQTNYHKVESLVHITIVQINKSVIRISTSSILSQILIDTNLVKRPRGGSSSGARGALAPTAKIIQK